MTEVEELRQRISELEAELELERRYRTMGGPPPAPEQRRDWTNVELPPPETASTCTACWFGRCRAHAVTRAIAGCTCCAQHNDQGRSR